MLFRVFKPVVCQIPCPKKFQDSTEIHKIAFNNPKFLPTHLKKNPTKTSSGLANPEDWQLWVEDFFYFSFFGGQLFESKYFVHLLCKQSQRCVFVKLATRKRLFMLVCVVAQYKKEQLS